jgi:hypothetical protein
MKKVLRFFLAVVAVFLLGVALADPSSGGGLASPPKPCSSSPC